MSTAGDQERADDRASVTRASTADPPARSGRERRTSTQGGPIGSARIVGVAKPSQDGGIELVGVAFGHLISKRQKEPGGRGHEQEGEQERPTSQDWIGGGRER